MPSVQSAFFVQGESGTHAPVTEHNGPATPEADAHCASDEHAVHTLATQTGVVGTSPQPPVASQSTHLCVLVLQRSSVPEQPPLSTQSTHVAVAGSHWFSVLSVQPAFEPGSQLEHRPERAPVVAQAVFACFAAQRAFDEAAWLQATQAAFSHSGAAALVQSASLRHSAQPDATQKRAVPDPEQAPLEPQPQARFVHVFVSAGSHPPLAHAVHWAALVGVHRATPPLSQHSWSFVHPLESPGSQAPH